MSTTLSVVIVVYDMARELPRTLQSLQPPYQQGISAAEYEIVVVDNGSPQPLDAGLFENSPVPIRATRIENASPSPVPAANYGIDRADGDLIGLVIDGARMASPGLLHTAQLASRLARRPVITSPAFHLGHVPHKEARAAGYDQATEDELLATSGWEADGYRLFDISTLSGSSGRGIFGPMGESSALFMKRELWDELGGLDEQFVLPGGGLVNHDLFQRACAAEGAELVVLLGEATFHQIHGGASTSGRFTWDEMHAEFVAIRGHENRPPPNAPRYVGTVPDSYVRWIEESSRRAAARLAR